MDKWLIVGLGNPGLRYKNTRHNIGWKAVDRFAKSVGTRLKKTSCGAKIIRVEAFEKKLVLAKPLSFMNLSGKPVKCLMSANEVVIDKIIIICDDIDLPVGAMRIRKKGSSGGQKGIASIITEIGSSEFFRIKIGIGRPENNLDVADYVLTNSNKDEANILDEVVKKAVSAIEMLMTEGFQNACNKFNSTNPENQSISGD
jgi:peptidyl-tRNA hydrolase, PTH1 family